MSRLRLAVTGLTGQVVSALIERSPRDVEIIALGRPQFDLSHRTAVLAGLRGSRCDVIVNAAAYTAVDQAESEPEVALRINGDGAGFVAEIAAELKVPLLHLSTDYVFDGVLDRPYREDDPPSPASAYGRSKLAGETKIARIHADHAIVRTSWIYSPFGANFVTKMLKLAAENSEIRVVADQVGNPTSAIDIADALLVMATRLCADSDASLRGVFHIAGAGAASWADVAEFALAESARGGGKTAKVVRIATSEYSTPARRPLNSQLDCAKLRVAYGLALPPWKASVGKCVARLIAARMPR